MQGFSIKAKSANKTSKNVFEGLTGSKVFEHDNAEDDNIGKRRVVSEINSQEEPAKEDLVINPEPNKQWFSANANRSLYVPAKQNGEVVEKPGGLQLSYGLNVIKKEPGTTPEAEDHKSTKSSLFAPSYTSEEQKFEADVADRPDQPDMDAYKRVPIDVFGAALLRGMGWKGETNAEDKESDKAVINLEKRRPAFLGLGAKPSGIQKPDSKQDKGFTARKRDAYYTPLVRRDRETGEIVPEDNNGHEKDRNEQRRSRSPHESSRSHHRPNNGHRGSYRRSRHGDSHPRNKPYRDHRGDGDRQE